MDTNNTPQKATLAEVQGTLLERESIAHFLAAHGSSTTAETLMLEMSCWWDSNPAQSESAPKGWILWHDGDVVGFLGAFACDYRYEKRDLKGLAATSWYVDPRFRTQSMLLFRRFFACRDEYLLLNTTPNEIVETVLDTYKFKHEKSYQRILFLTRQPLLSLYSFLNLYRRKYNRLLPKTKRKFSSSLEGITDNKCAYPNNAIVKDCSLGALRWMVEAKGASARSIAVLKQGSNLTAYMIFRSSTVRKLPGLTCIQFGYESREEFLELLASVSTYPERMMLPFKPKFFFLNMFKDQEQALALDADHIVQHTGTTQHYYYLPQSLHEAPKVCMLAEGDFGRFGCG